MAEDQYRLIDSFDEDPEPIEFTSDLEELFFSELSTNAVYQSTDWTVTTILDQISRERIILKPSFQRRDAWDEYRKSRFIESLILNFPIPQLVLAELKDQRGKYIVIDGKQRLLSLVQFAGIENEKEKFNKLTLRGLEVLPYLNGYDYATLSNDHTNLFNIEDFDNRTIRTVVIRNWKNESVLYHIFLRLNTGSVSLSPQELRNALHPGKFADYIDLESGISPALRKILGRKEPDFRMRDAEILLRYFAFRNFLHLYSGSMKEFLDKTTQILNKEWETRSQEIHYQREQFEKAVKLTYEVFGVERAFKKYKNGQFIGRFNRAVFDIMIYNFWSEEVQNLVRERRENVIQAYIDLSNSNPEFLDAIESTTKSLGATYIRFSLWTITLNRTLGLNLPVPQMINNKIIVTKQ